MIDRHELAMVILDAQWRPVERLARPTDWRALVQALLARECRWLALEQERRGHGSPLPDASDIALTRSLCRHLRPMDMHLADHVIRAAGEHFSFRAAGLL